MKNKKIPEDIINEIRNKTNIVDIISEYVTLNKKGRNYFGLCPFHDDNTPSMSVSPDKQIYRCFTCGAGGNVYTFLMEHENISFSEAVSNLSIRTGVKIPEEYNVKSTKKEYDDSTKKLITILKESQKFYHHILVNTSFSSEALNYLNNRGFNNDIINEFNIGFAPLKENNLTKYMLSKGYNEKTLVESTLTIRNDYGYFDRFQNRIMFPIYDNYGLLVGYSGRIIQSSDQPKYINSPENKLFKKGEILYNFYQAKNEIRRRNRVILMEGFMDVITANTIGLKETIASMGTALTTQQANAIRRLTKNVIICYDGDNAGQKATYKACEVLKDAGCDVKVTILRENLDPDDYIKKYGKDKFINEIDNSISEIDFKLQFFKKGKDFTKSEDKTKYLEECIKVISNVKSDIQQEFYLNKLSIEFGININTLKHELQHKTQHTINRYEYKSENTESSKQIPVPKSKYEKSEELLLAYMLKYKKVSDLYEKHVGYLPTENYRVLANHLVLEYKQTDRIIVSDLVSKFYDKIEMVELITYITELIDNNNLNDSEFNEQEIMDYIKTIKEYNIHSAIKRLENEMNQINDPMEQAKIAERIRELNMMR